MINDTDNININIDNGFKLLIEAVIEQAASDYRYFSCVQKNSDSKTKREKAKYECEKIEKFFLRDDFYLSSKISGDYILKNLKEQLESFNYDYQAIKKYLSGKKMEEKNND